MSFLEGVWFLIVTNTTTLAFVLSGLMALTFVTDKRAIIAGGILGAIFVYIAPFIVEQRSATDIYDLMALFAGAIVSATYAALFLLSRKLISISFRWYFSRKGAA